VSVLTDLLAQPAQANASHLRAAMRTLPLGCWHEKRAYSCASQGVPQFEVTVGQRQPAGTPAARAPGSFPQRSDHSRALVQRTSREPPEAEAGVGQRGSAGTAAARAPGSFPQRSDHTRALAQRTLREPPEAEAGVGQRRPAGTAAARAPRSAPPRSDAPRAGLRARDDLRQRDCSHGTASTIERASHIRALTLEVSGRALAGAACRDAVRLDRLVIGSRPGQRQRR